MNKLKHILAVVSLMCSHATQATDCLPTIRSEGNCSYSIPPLKNGLAAVVSSNSGALFSGAVAVACNDGNLTLGKLSCKPVNESDCAVPTASWEGDSGQFCEHSMQESPLLDGKTVVIPSKSALGSVTYSCKNGKLAIEKAECGVIGERVGVIESAGVQPAMAVSNANSLAASQSTIATTKSYSFDLRFLVPSNQAGNSSSVQTAAKAKCAEVAGYDAASGAAGIKTTPDGTVGSLHIYSAECPVKIKASCDQDYILVNGIVGNYNQNKGEYTDPPSRSRLGPMCAQEGYSTYNSTIYLDRSWPNIVDDFTAILSCSGKASACESQPPSVNQRIVSAISCSEANVAADALAVTAGGAVTLSAIQAQVCGPLKFSSAKSILSSKKVSSSATIDYYSVAAVCDGYTASATAPLRSDCSSGNCLGGVLPPNSNLPYIEIDGSRYENLCSVPGVPPASLCADCKSGSFSFKDPNNGNSCTITAPEMFSGKTQNVVFLDSATNGTVDLSCNNGERSLAKNGIAKCYRSCSGGVKVSWAGAGGASCSQSTPLGSFANGQSVSVTSTIDGSGTANLQCDGENGSWVVKSATCSKGCSGTISWGQNNACSATLPSMKNGDTGSVSSTIGGSGNTSYRCNNGAFEIYASSCNVSCQESTQIWGSVCINKVPLIPNGQSTTVLHNSSMSTTSAGLGATGSATFSCVNGVTNLVSGSCKYKVTERVGPWGDWYNVGEQSCTTYEPDAATIPSGTPFTQTRTCSINQQREQVTYAVWSDQTETVLSVKTEPKTVKNTESRSQVGSEATIDPFKDVMIACGLKEMYPPLAFNKCQGASRRWPKHGSRIYWVVGDSFNGYASKGFEDPSNWSISWSGDCTGTGAVCDKVVIAPNTADLVYHLNPDFVASFKAIATVTHIPTGKKASFPVEARTCYQYNHEGWVWRCSIDGVKQ